MKAQTDKANSYLLIIERHECLAVIVEKEKIS